ncbi:sugar phosphate isomerase/epimerase [Luteolibacter ambystomatis]|uniref:Sugar phosphate isomerase/epimerase n=1 Tax=Luteolibacter ambystomatis TaxID=2824561 RepID=A0A975G8M6_9BACT|nr:sugar phosphate isomerase/epimerase family protein [Luteolibacter ambystomatis]QUE50828.1 sugar phosphate isomerase/epimerase [Luteolibacter ambystomatis]
MSRAPSPFRTAVTLCTFPEAASGPFVFHGTLEVGFAKAVAHGFGAVELFLAGPDAVPVEEIVALSDQHQLAIAAVGSGAGMVKHGLSLTDPDAGQREKARTFLREMIHFAGKIGAPVILGSMQGKSGGAVSREQALDWLAEALHEAGATAAEYHVPFLYEPLNRYETNLFNRQAIAAAWLAEREITNVKLLADLFHMNIEEDDIAAALVTAGPWIGHIHWADSQRRAMGTGHTDPAPIIAALRQIGYAGHISAEIFPQPDADAAASQTLASLRPFATV